MSDGAIDVPQRGHASPRAVSRAEIAAELGFKSANAAEEHLQALARKGAIELVSGTSRGIRLKSGRRNCTSTKCNSTKSSS